MLGLDTRRCTSTVMLPIIALWCPSRVSIAILMISSSDFPMNCWHADANISSFWPCILTWNIRQASNHAQSTRNSFEPRRTFCPVNLQSFAGHLEFSPDISLWNVWQISNFSLDILSGETKLLRRTFSKFAGHVEFRVLCMQSGNAGKNKLTCFFYIFLQCLVSGFLNGNLLVIPNRFGFN